MKNNKWVRAALITIALIYALLAGLRLVSETDLGWQMAAGRYVVQHHAIPSTVLSNYTVSGAPWIYPPLSGVIFYLLYLMGGYSAISWFSALACAGTVALTMWRGGKTTAALAIIAVPEIAFRTMPRADLFTTVLFAAVLVLLWRYLEGVEIWLGVLPTIMFLWVNLHPGFVAGLAMIGGYVFLEACDAVFFAERRAAAIQRLRRALPWILASAAITLVNPWGIGIYRALQRQGQVTLQLTQFVGEWSGVHFNALALRQFFSLRDPGGTDWWLMALATVIAVVCLLKKRVGAAILMAGALCESIAHIRFQAILALLVIVIGGATLPEVTSFFKSRRKEEHDDKRKMLVPAIALVSLFAIFAGVRAYDLVSNQYYLDAGETTLFGAGESWWFPEKAMSFLEREKLPANLFHDYNAGGYLTWRVGKTYPDFADGRFIPFVGEVFLKQRALLAASPDSALWQDSAGKWNLNTIVLSLSRIAGLSSYPLGEYCRSANWKPVYVDDVSIVFVSVRPEDSALLAKFPVSCEKMVLTPPAAAQGDSLRARAEQFNFFLNSASVYYILSRDSEAFSALAQAAKLFPDNPGLHLVTAQLLQANHRVGEAEQEYLRVVNAKPSDEAWFALATLYNAQKRYLETERCIKESIGYSQIPYERLRSLGLLYISLGRAKDALAAFDRADEKSPFRNDTVSEEGRSFNLRMVSSRVKALRTMNDLPGAIEQQERLTQLTPGNPDVWDALAELRQAQGDTEKAKAAHAWAEMLRVAEHKNSVR